MAMLFVSGSRRTSRRVSALPGSPGRASLPIRRMFTASSGSGGRSLFRAWLTAAATALLRSPMSPSVPFVHPRAKPGSARTTATTASPTIFTARRRPYAR